jgi:NAD(P)-dependent dehydrogenase (short-subunit alcohol dehydrogenase family)
MLNGKRIVVTGAANGCGAGAVSGFITAGASVFATDIDDSAGRALLSETRGGERLIYQHLDVSDRDAVFAAVDAAAEAMGGIDALVHPAGVVHNAPAIDATMAQWDRIFDIHVKGTVHANQAVFRHLCKAGGGAIINFGSIAGVRGMPGFSIYGAAKGAVLAWTRNLALEWGVHNIRVNAVMPAMESRMTEASRAACTPEQLEQLTAATSAATAIRGTLGDPTIDLAPMLALLVSDGGSYITGQAIAVDGGMMMLGS